jgi:hypothetical protein
MRARIHHHKACRWSAIVAGAIALAVAAASPASAAVVLSDGNSTATLSLDNQAGMSAWVVDGIDHMYQQWFWYRLGTDTQEYSIDTLTSKGVITSDIDGSGQDETVVANYSGAGFDLQLRYVLTGGMANSGASDISEVIRIQNTSDVPLVFHFFQYSDFDLGLLAGDDSVVLTGASINTATQSDPSLVIGETVVTPPPTRWEANFFANTLNALNDGDIDDLDNNAGPLGPGDVTWAFQWSFDGQLAIPVRGTVLISKDKGIRLVPEPSTLALAGLGLAAVLVVRRRRSR